MFHETSSSLKLCHNHPNQLHINKQWTQCAWNKFIYLLLDSALFLTLSHVDTPAAVPLVLSSPLLFLLVWPINVNIYNVIVIIIRILNICVAK